jgi:hypothetical protein
MNDLKNDEIRKRNIRALIVLALIAVAFYGGFIAMTAMKG